MIVRLIRLSIETGCVTGQHIIQFCLSAHIAYVAKCQRIPALSAGVLVVLVFLPGNPPYYAVDSAVVAKIYSNSMMAMLNSRVKPVSNAPASAAPSWNESAKPVGSGSSTGWSQGFVFRRGSERGFHSSCDSEFPV